MIKYLGVFLLLAIMLVGCSYIYNVRVVGNNSLIPQFILNKPMWVRPLGISVPLTDFSVYEKKAGEWNVKSPIWQIRIKQGVEKRVGKIYYGQIPNGFEEVVKSQNLLANTPYMAQCFGWGGGHGGSVTFMIVKDRDIYRIATKKKGEEVWETDVTH